MSALFRFWIVLAVTWLLGLMLMVFSVIQHQSFPQIMRSFRPEFTMSWLSRTMQRVGNAAVNFAIGLGCLILVYLILNPWLPSPLVDRNRQRIEIIERWIVRHDSLAKLRIP